MRARARASLKGGFILLRSLVIGYDKPLGGSDVLIDAKGTIRKGWWAEESSCSKRGLAKPSCRDGLRIG